MIQVDGLVDSTEDIIIMILVDGEVGVDSTVVVDTIAMPVEVAIIEKENLRRDFQKVCCFVDPIGCQRLF